MTLDPRLAGTTVTITDARRAGFCVRGVQRWFSGRSNFHDFLKNGLPAEEVAAFGDALADRVLKSKIERMNDGR